MLFYHIQQIEVKRLFVNIVKHCYNAKKEKEVRFMACKRFEQLAGVVNIPNTILNDYENDEKNQDVGSANFSSPC